MVDLYVSVQYINMVLAVFLTVFAVIPYVIMVAHVWPSLLPMVILKTAYMDASAKMNSKVSIVENVK